MMKRYIQLFLATLAVVILFLPVQAQARISFHEVPWGMVKVDLNLDGETDLVVHTWPDDDLSMKTVQVQFLIFDGESEDGLRSVRIEGRETPYFTLPKQEEGECKAYDFALMATGKTRDTRRFDMIFMTKSQEVDAENNATVKFEHYRLQKDVEEAAANGGNPYIYVKADEFASSEAYCDVKKAFEDNIDTIADKFDDPDPRAVQKEEKKEEAVPE